MAVRSLRLESNREANPTDQLHEKCPKKNVQFPKVHQTLEKTNIFFSFCDKTNVIINTPSLFFFSFFQIYHFLQLNIKELFLKKNIYKRVNAVEYRFIQIPRATKIQTHQVQPNKMRKIENLTIIELLHKYMAPSCPTVIV